MKQIFTLIILLTLTVFGFSQTNVSGPYFSNTNWTLSGSPYNVVGDVQIPADITLTIDAGVEINFAGNYEILIKGSIIANGNLNNPINFIEQNEGKAMLMFKETNLSNSQLTYINFTGEKDAIQLADESEHNQADIKNTGILTISNVNLSCTKVRTKGFHTEDSLVIDNATVIESSLVGVAHAGEFIEVNLILKLEQVVLISISYHQY